MSESGEKQECKQKNFIVTFKDGNKYSIPASVIACHRAQYQAERASERYGWDFDEQFMHQYLYGMKYEWELFEFSMTMYWSELEPHARLIEGTEVDRHSAWEDHRGCSVEIVEL